MSNIFSQIKQKKEQVKSFAQKALGKSWISQEEYQDIIQKIDNDVLTIGVIGQMKAGKSTFLNAFLFGEEILPAATTPMTAALSVITYGEKKEIEVEFYTKQEWEEIKMSASMNPDQFLGDKIMESKIKAAKELVERAAKIGSELGSILGGKKKDSLQNLIEYVGADGKYVSVTKSVVIHYPEEWLKGVRVVDTPGFNDPIVSREERTQEFLKQADAVLLLVYAGRAFDATDREIIFEKVRKVGIGKVLVGINKYDVQYEQGETIEEIINNVKHEITKACTEENDETIKELLHNIEPIPFSANMALMAKMPLEIISKNEQIKFYWNKACEIFEISTQKQMLEKSLVGVLEQTIRDTIEKSKAEILLRKPIHQIISIGTDKFRHLEEQINKNVVEKETLSESDEDWEAKLKDIERATKRINCTIEDRLKELREGTQNIVRSYRRSAEDQLDDLIRRLKKTVQDNNKSKAESDVKNECDSFNERNLKRLAEDKSVELRNQIKQSINTICDEVEDYLRRYLKDDYEDILRRYKGLLGKEEEIISANLQEKTENKGDGIGFFEAALTITAFPVVLPVITIINLLTWRDDFYKYIDGGLKSKLKEAVSKYVTDLEAVRGKYLSSIDEDAASCILTDLCKKRDEYRGREQERIARIAELEGLIAKLLQDKNAIEEELTDMKNISKGIV